MSELLATKDLIMRSYIYLHFGLNMLYFLKWKKSAKHAISFLKVIRLLARQYKFTASLMCYLQVLHYIALRYIAIYRNISGIPELICLLC